MLVVVALLVPLTADAQITFERTYGSAFGEWGYSVEETSDGGYIIAGGAEPYAGGQSDAYLIKTDISGDTVWTRTYGGSNWDWGYSAEETDDDGYIIGGYTGSFGAGGDDVYLIKTDSSGDTIWTRTYGGPDYDHGRSVDQTSDGGYIIVGEFQPYGGAPKDVYLVKTGASGETVWTRTYGGGDEEYGRSVDQTSDGGYIVGAWAASFGAGGLDVYLLKVDASGDTVWTRTYGGQDHEEDRWVRQTSDGGYVMAGFSESFGSGGYDIYVIKTDATGDTAWTRTYGGSDDEYGYSVEETGDGGYVIAGYTASFGAGGYDVYLIKTDASGDTVWTRTYGGADDDYARSIDVTSDGGYVVAGYTASFGAGGDDVYLIKTDAEGLVQVTEEPREEPHPGAFALMQNRPNPFRATTAIRFALPSAQPVKVTLYDARGAVVRELTSGKMHAGVHELLWDGLDARGREVASGIYFYRLEAGDFSETKRMVLLR
ncbi:hypothetical protein AMJ39_06520 [candidate division TA06 bacterium DG_24]|uniref:FlgD/Vpr Ig-like domain-containing protein n=3 Tax=Bacteria division TA06 TaxID=1156500 RepID=A0A0S8JDD5_UNCT6|nr:MAG: hypothetical protein AMJ39_06520 [candidate division TA06 bacterium DG_24]KPK68080.1 MAG: hypothetical protein AMJ82_09140 [candidate division TA06 bacterium SM23_40]KPL07472.1 MAG: hypothetical protein AMJ71_08940 [candidate division TA06 bacterium SM1_40]